MAIQAGQWLELIDYTQASRLSIIRITLRYLSQHWCVGVSTPVGGLAVRWARWGASNPRAVRKLVKKRRFLVRKWHRIAPVDHVSRYHKRLSLVRSTL